MGYVGKMGEKKMSIVTIDKRGRLVIPRKIREELNIREGDPFLALRLGNDTIVLKRINLKALAENIAREIAGSSINLEAIVEEIELKSNKIAREKIKEISSRH